MGEGQEIENDVKIPVELTKAQRLERELQMILDERAASLGELIETTVALHKSIQKEVKQLLEQDKEEDILVQESVTRTKLAERELERNPMYDEFKKKRTGKEDWAMNADIRKLGRWTGLITLTPSDCREFLNCKKEGVPLPQSLADAFSNGTPKTNDKIFVKICGNSIHDLHLTLPEDTATLLREATALLASMREKTKNTDKKASPSEINKTAHFVNTIHALCEADAHHLCEAMANSKVFLKQHCTPAVINDNNVHICITPLAGAMQGVSMRGYIMKNRLKMVEVYDSEPGAEIKSNVEAFVYNLIRSHGDVIGGTCVVDMWCEGSGVYLDWIHRLDPEMPQGVSWEDLCAQSLSSDPASWHYGIRYHDTIPHTVSLLSAEAFNMTAANPVWGPPTPTPITALLNMQVRPLPVVTATHVEPVVGADEASSSTMLLAASTVAVGFFAGFLAARKK